MDIAYRSILLPVDLGHESSWRRSLPVAIAQARMSNPPARLHILSVLPSFDMSIVGQFLPDGIERTALDELTRRQHAFIASHLPGDLQVEHSIGQGPVYQVILDTAARLDVDLIVMAAHRPELRDYLIGANAARVVRHAACSVLVVRE